jgi:hypothetical protein
MFGKNMWGTVMWGTSGAIAFALAAACRLYIVPFENRFDVVEFENRFFNVPFENRFDLIPPAIRTIKVTRESRKSKIYCDTSEEV